MGCLKLDIEHTYTGLKVPDKSGQGVYGVAVKVSRGSGKNEVETNYYYFGEQGNKSQVNLAFGRRETEQSQSPVFDKVESQHFGIMTKCLCGNRYYDPRTSQWLSVDPLASKYPNMSPYNYCGGNPVNAVDPNGMYIEEGSQAEWEKQRSAVTSRRDNLQSKIDRLTNKSAAKGWSESKLNRKLGNLGERVGSLNSTLSTMDVIEGSSQGYSLKSGAGEVGGTYFDNSSGYVVLNFSSTANFVHEATHAGQFEAGDLAFDPNTLQGTYAQDLFDEVDAYKAEFAYSGTSVGGIGLKASSFSAITPEFVKNITTSTGVQPYINHGLIPININSGKANLLKAYPHASSSLMGLPDSFKLRDLTDIIYKK